MLTNTNFVNLSSVRGCP